MAADKKPTTPEVKPAVKAADKKPLAEKPENKKPQEKVARQWIALGSADPNDPYRMLVTLDNQGAALVRLELSSPRYRDLEDRTGYLGHVVIDEVGTGPGCLVQVVGPGTPAAKANLKPGDRITAVNEKAVDGDKGLEDALSRTRPGQTVDLSVTRGGKQITLQPTLIRRPLEVVRPEPKKPPMLFSERRYVDPVHQSENCPLSLLTTLQQIDDEKIPPEDEDANKVDLDRELKGIDLRTANWKIDPKSDQTHAIFRLAVPERDIEVIKTYRLAEVPADAAKDADMRAYHLEFELEIRNTGEKPRVLAYRLDGPNGLPHEGAWYASKGQPKRSRAARHYLSARRGERHSDQLCNSRPPTEAKRLAADDKPFRFLAVDAQYFAAAMLKMPPELERAFALRVGEADPQMPTITNTSFRVNQQTGGPCSRASR